MSISINDFIEAAYPNFTTLYSGVLKDKISKYFKVPENQLTISNIPSSDAFSYGAFISIFLISGRDIKATLKIHYNPSENADLLRLKNTNNSLSDEAALSSIFSELGNLLAGTLKASFLDMGYTVGISLPIEASDYDEIISSDKLVKGRKYAYDSISIGSSVFSVTLAIDDDGDGLSKYVYEQPKENEEDYFL
jgi:hypothetical protein